MYPPYLMCVADIARVAAAFKAGECHVAYRGPQLPGAGPGAFLLVKRSGQYGFGCLRDLVPRDRGSMFVEKDKDLEKLLGKFLAEYIPLYVFGRWDDVMEWVYAKPPVAEAIDNLICQAKAAVALLQPSTQPASVDVCLRLQWALDDLGVVRPDRFGKERQ